MIKAVILGLLWVGLGTLAPLQQAAAQDKADAPAYALEGEYLYKVTTLRAEHGQFESLLETITLLQQGDYYKGRPASLIMRHSQGDQWDIMAMLPMGSWAEYYKPETLAMRAAAVQKNRSLITRLYNDIAFAEDVFVTGPDYEQLKAAYMEKGLYHIEMFHAVGGKQAQLYKQRQMENNYLISTGQTPNMIFKRVGRAAGFKDRADLSFYLRSLLHSHHDTFATKP